MLNNIVAQLGTGAGGGGGAFESIATWTASGGETSVTLSSIPSTYQHIQLRILTARNTAGGIGYYMRPNSDSSTSYSYHNLIGNGSTVSASGSSSQTEMQITNLGGNDTYYGGTIIDILDYASTSKYKTVRSFGGLDTNSTTGQVIMSSGLWQSTSAISSLYFIFGGAPLKANSTFALYGIKGS